MKHRIFLFLSPLIPLLFISFFFFVVKKQNAQQRMWELERLSDQWRQDAITRIEWFRTSFSFESQINQIIQNVKFEIGERIKKLPNEKVNLTGEILSSAILKVFPRSHLPKESNLYGVSLDSSLNPTLLSGKGLVTNKSRMIVEMLEKFVKSSKLETREKEALNKRCLGLFGEFATFELIGTFRKGLLTPVQFQGEDSFMIWDTVLFGNKTIGAFLLVLPKKTKKSSSPLRFALSCISPPTSSGMLPILVPLASANQRLPIIHTFSTKPTSYFSRLFKSILPPKEREVKAPHGTKIDIEDFWVIRDFVHLDLPYEIWIVSKPLIPRLFWGDFLEFFIRLLLLFSFLGMYLYAFITGKGLAISMKIWFMGFFAFVGGAPLIVLYTLGLQEQKLHDLTRGIQAKQESIDLESASVFKRFILECRGLIANKKWFDIITNDEFKILKEATDQAFSHFELQKPKLPLSLILLYPFEKNPMAFSSKNRFLKPSSSLQTNVQNISVEEKTRMDVFNSLARRGFEVITAGSDSRRISDLTDKEKLVLSCFRSANGSDPGKVFFALRRFGDRIANRENQIFSFHDFLAENNKPKTCVVFLADGSEANSNFLREKLIDLNLEDKFSIFALGKVVSGVSEPLYPPPNETIWQKKEEDERGDKLLWLMNLAARTGLNQVWVTGAKEEKIAREESKEAKRLELFHSVSENEIELDETQKVLFTAYPCSRATGFVIGSCVPIHGIYSEASKRKTELVAIVVLIGTCILFLGWTTAKYLLFPLSLVESGLNKIASGNLSVRVGLPREDELGELSREFDAMIKGLEERKELAHFVSGALEADLSARSGTSRMEPEQKTGTVLVSDIRNFTTLSEKYPAREIVSMLNSHLEEMTKEIKNHGGMIDKFIGDAVVAIFFDDALGLSHRKALRAAIGMMKSHRALNEARVGRQEFGYDIGVGLDCGNLLVGSLGSSGRLEYTALGLPRSHAEQLEPLSKKGNHTKIIASLRIAKQAPWFNFSPLSEEEGFELVDFEERE
ncbi:adenylate/guanylate cyclase domain-containing protein [bacterium]|nr:adenylate/guanylate cyclase domain-containing protein [bacterium]